MHRVFLAIGTLLLAVAPAVARQAQTGAVTGMLRFATGQPAVGVRVAATSPPDRATGRKASLVSQTITDDSGHYRLEDIPPGRYYLQAGAVDSPTYYPGVQAIDDAKSLLIGAGAPIENIDFNLSLPTQVRIRGRVPGTGQPTAIRLSKTS